MPVRSIHTVQHPARIAFSRLLDVDHHCGVCCIIEMHFNADPHLIMLCTFIQKKSTGRTKEKTVHSLNLHSAIVGVWVWRICKKIPNLQTSVLPSHGQID